MYIVFFIYNIYFIKGLILLVIWFFFIAWFFHDFMVKCNFHSCHCSLDIKAKVGGVIFWIFIVNVFMLIVNAGMCFITSQTFRLFNCKSQISGFLQHQSLWIFIIIWNVNKVGVLLYSYFIFGLSNQDSAQNLITWSMYDESCTFFFKTYFHQPFTCNPL